MAVLFMVESLTVYWQCVNLEACHTVCSV